MGAKPALAAGEVPGDYFRDNPLVVSPMTGSPWHPVEDAALLALRAAHGTAWADHLAGAGIARSVAASQKRLHKLLFPNGYEAAPRRRKADPPWPEGLRFGDNPAAKRDCGTPRHAMASPDHSRLRPALARVVR